MELLKKDEVLNAIADIDVDIYETSNPIETLFNRIISKIDSLETIEGPKTARWKVAGFWTICDNCGKELTGSRWPKYCPNCGSMME